MTAPHSLVARVLRIVTEKAGPSRTPSLVGAETPLGELGFWLDSVDLVEVVLACEQEFSLTLDDETDLNETTLATIGSLAALFARKAAADACA